MNAPHRHEDDPRRKSIREVVGRRIFPAALIDERGYTLVEILMLMSVTILIAGVLMTTVGKAMFSEPEGGVAEDLRQVARVFVKDVTNAEGTDLVDGARPVSTIALFSTVLFRGVSFNEVTDYKLVDDQLLRTHEGNTLVVAQKLASVRFSLSGNEITAVLEANTGSDNSQTITLKQLINGGN